MKKTIILGLVGIMALFAVQGISANESGVMIGINFASVKQAGATTGFGIPLDSGGQTGLSIGFFYSFTLLDWLSLQSDLLFVQNGFMRKLPSDDGILEQRIKLNYLELPLMIRIQPNRNLYAMAGIYWGFKLSARLQTQNSDQVSLSESLSSARNIDQGWLTAFGLILDDESGAFIEIRYKQGNRGVLDIPADVAQANVSLSLSLGYGF